MTKDVYLVKSDEGGDSDVLLFEERDAFLGCVDGVHHNVVQSATTRGNGHIVLLINRSKVSL